MLDLASEPFQCLIAAGDESLECLRMGTKLGLLTMEWEVIEFEVIRMRLEQKWIGEFWDEVGEDVRWACGRLILGENSR